MPLAHALKTFFDEHKLPTQGRAHRPREQPDRRPHLRHRRHRRRDPLRQRRPVQGPRGAAGRAARVGARLPRPRRAAHRGRRAARSASCSSSRRAIRSSRITAVARQAGLKLAGIDLEALGLLRAFVEPKPFAVRAVDDTATVVVSIGHESSTLLVAGGGACEFTRVFDWGGGALQEADRPGARRASRRGSHDPPAPLALGPRPAVRDARRGCTRSGRSRPFDCGSHRSRGSSSARSSSTRPSRTRSVSARS